MMWYTYISKIFLINIPYVGKKKIFLLKTDKTFNLYLNPRLWYIIEIGCKFSKNAQIFIYVF